MGKSPVKTGIMDASTNRAVKDPMNLVISGGVQIKEKMKKT